MTSKAVFQIYGGLNSSLNALSSDGTRRYQSCNVNLESLIVNTEFSRLTRCLWMTLTTSVQCPIHLKFQCIYDSYKPVVSGQDYTPHFTLLNEMKS